jgi:hypothetical protein
MNRYGLIYAMIKALRTQESGMRSVRFRAAGHENIVGKHETTLELTSESKLTKRGTCVIGVRASQTLRDLDDEIRNLARRRETRICLRMTVEGQVEEVRGRGDPGLTYTDNTSMVVRKSSYQCGRTVFVNADKAASDLDREFIRKLKDSRAVLECELLYFNE